MDQKIIDAAYAGGYTNEAISDEIKYSEAAQRMHILTPGFWDGLAKSYGWTIEESEDKTLALVPWLPSAVHVHVINLTLGWSKAMTFINALKPATAEKKDDENKLPTGEV
jgi:hypothetical protein